MRGERGPKRNGPSAGLHAEAVGALCVSDGGLKTHSQRIQHTGHRFRISHVAARSKRARRNVALHFRPQRHVLSTQWNFLGAGRAFEPACSSFGITGTRPWPPRRTRLPLSSLLSRWLLALLRQRKVGGDRLTETREITPYLWV